MDYSDSSALSSAVSALRRLPPLVTTKEIKALKQHVAEAALGKRFLLMGGDCAERFADCYSQRIVNQMEILVQVSGILAQRAGKPVTHIGRIAGQYAKPRSANLEMRDGVCLPAFRGDIYNQTAFTAEARNPDPKRLLMAYRHAATTLYCLRHHMVMDHFTTHEGLALEYEAAQTYQEPQSNQWYDLTTHLPWIGERTLALDSAHVAFFRGIANPIGIKLGPSVSPAKLLALMEVLDPDQQPGRLTLIHRFGVDQIGTHLPTLLEAVQRSGRVPCWCCDPMHGNTEITASGVKTRRFDAILGELELAFAIHARMGTLLGGMHLELTGEHVTECLGGECAITEEELGHAYKSTVDPRLNARQSVELAQRSSQWIASSTTLGVRQRVWDR